jgi:hypothetical protein
MRRFCKSDHKFQLFRPNWSYFENQYLLIKKERQANSTVLGQCSYGEYVFINLNSLVIIIFHLLSLSVSHIFKLQFGLIFPKFYYLNSFLPINNLRSQIFKLHSCFTLNWKLKNNFFIKFLNFNSLIRFQTENFVFPRQRFLNTL